MCCIACHAIGDVFNGIPDGISGLGEDVSVLECHTKKIYVHITLEQQPKCSRNSLSIYLS